MPSVLTTIEDNSPFISYSSDWIAGNSSDDDFVSSYSSSNFMLTKTEGGTMTFTFNGTAIQIFGAKRDNHGSYQVAVDGTQFPVQSGEANPSAFQTPLFSVNSLQNGQHTVVLTNLGSGNNAFVDIDFITWQTTVGNDGDQLLVNTVQDSDPAFYYSPLSTWSNSPSNLGTFAGSSGHVTNTSGSSFVYTFEGDGVSLYGPVGPDYAPFSVAADGGPSASYSANRQFFSPKAMLYHVDNLGSGSHTVKVTCQSVASGQSLAVDYAEVFTTDKLLKSTGSTKRLDGGSIAGIIIGLAAIVGIVICLVFLLLRRRIDRERHRNDTETSSHRMTAPEFIQYLASIEPYQYGATSSVAGSSYSAQPQQQLVSSAESSFVANTYPRQGEVNTSGKGRVPLPPSAAQSLAHISENDLRANRMVVEGRPQDFGSLSGPVSNGAGDDGGRSVSMLPPDYSQATQGCDHD